MIENLKKQIAKYSKLLYQSGLVGAAGGNVSMKFEDKFLVTAGGRSLREIKKDEIIVVDENGNMLEEKSNLKPSKETMLHINVYKARDDVDSIIHAHPAYLTAYAVKNKKLPILTASAKLKLIDVPMVKYCAPGSKGLAENVFKTVRDAPDNISAISLSCHGLIAFSKGLENCFNIAELAEESAKTAFISENIK